MKVIFILVFFLLSQQAFSQEIVWERIFPHLYTPALFFMCDPLITGDGNIFVAYSTLDINLSSVYTNENLGLLKISPDGTLLSSFNKLYPKKVNPQFLLETSDSSIKLVNFWYGIATDYGDDDYHPLIINFTQGGKFISESIDTLSSTTYIFLGSGQLIQNQSHSLVNISSLANWDSTVNKWINKMIYKEYDSIGHFLFERTIDSLSNRSLKVQLCLIDSNGDFIVGIEQQGNNNYYELAKYDKYFHKIWMIDCKNDTLQLGIKKLNYNNGIIELFGVYQPTYKSNKQNYGFYIHRYDSNGNNIGELLIKNTWTSNLSDYIFMENDNSYILVGDTAYTNYPHSDFEMMATDCVGNLIWEKHWKDSLTLKYINNIVQYDKENIIVSGIIDSNVYVAKIHIPSTSVINPSFSGSNLIISPNPASDFININIGTEILSQTKDIEIYSVFGNIVLDTPLASPLFKGENYKIDVSGLPQGVYFCKVLSGMDVKTGKFVVVR